MDRRAFLKALAGVAVVAPLSLSQMASLVTEFASTKRGEVSLPPALQPEPDIEELYQEEIRKILAKHAFIDEVRLDQRVDKYYAWQITCRYGDHYVCDIVDQADLVLNVGKGPHFHMLHLVAASANIKLMRAAHRA